MFATATSIQAATITSWLTNKRGTLQTLTVALDDPGDSAKVRCVVRSNGKPVAQREDKINGVATLVMYTPATTNLTASCEELPWWDSWLD